MLPPPTLPPPRSPGSPQKINIRERSTAAGRKQQSRSTLASSSDDVFVRRKNALERAWCRGVTCERERVSLAAEWARGVETQVGSEGCRGWQRRTEPPHGTGIRNTGNSRGPGSRGGGGGGWLGTRGRRWQPALRGNEGWRG